MSILVVSSSLNPKSRSRLLARRAFARLQEKTGAEAEVSFLDLQELPLPLCDGAAAYGDPNAHRALQAVRAAQAVLMAVPVYNYDVNAALKNFIELTGRAWEGKIAGFLCSAGGAASYMSVMGVANSLMLDFRCLIVPRFVYATGAHFSEAGLADPEIENRVVQLADETLRLVTALAPKTLS